jgi:DNA sulfur modification protein DndD
MLLKSIKLKNFRQFQGESIAFAEGKDGKNVTIILGENGTGKTTFAQAFFWCLYGETDFSDKSLLNKLVEKKLFPGQSDEVMVELCLHHGAVDYTLTRKQVYTKYCPNKLKSDNTIFSIAKKDKTGNTIYVKPSLCESEVKSILPKELSKYFFFDGERIERMSKDISTRKKATDFAEAVKGLLGLNGMSSAITHFNPKLRNSVIGSYEASYNSQSNSKIQEYTDTIERCKIAINEIEKRIEELDSEIDLAEVKKDQKSEEIKKYAEGEKLQNEKEKLQKKIEITEKMKSTMYPVICNSFNGSLSSFLSISMVQRAMEFLSNKDFSGIDIPFMNNKTIVYLLNRKTCICGTSLDSGTKAYNEVQKLISMLPPNSISNTVGDFKKTARNRANKLLDLQKQIKDNLAIISQQDDDLDNLKSDLIAIENKLIGDDVREKVRSINKEIQTCIQIISKDAEERDQKQRECGAKESEMKRADTERRNLTLLDDKNKKIEIYKAYAERIFTELQTVYDSSENKIRDRLQVTINDIFKQIYEGDLYLTIDEKYHISVYANDYEGDIETSTAQSIFVIFAFITGIIKMARENRNSSDENAKLLSSEPYPLVMDAPLSAFDKRRIKTVCEGLPQTAEQVIIFIKDTDGELAEKYMGNQIGNMHHLEKKNEFETVLV